MYLILPLPIPTLAAFDYSINYYHAIALYDIYHAPIIFIVINIKNTLANVVAIKLLLELCFALSVII